MNENFLGIDVSKDKIDVTLLESSKSQSAIFSNDLSGFKTLRRWLKRRGVKQLHACMEATGRYGDELAFYLFEQDFQVSVVNPARIKKYAESKLQRNKTDKIDGRLIADFCATQKPPLWSPPPEEIRILQEMTRRLESLKGERTREKNRLQAGVSAKSVKQSIEKHIAFLDSEIKRLTDQINHHIKQYPHLKEKLDLVQTIQGIGRLTASIILSELPDIDEFESASQATAYAGLTPRLHQSGSSVYRPSRMSKAGNRHLRAAFYMPSLSAIKWNPVIKDMVGRMQAKGKKPMVIIGAVMRKLLRLAYGVLKTGLPFDAEYHNSRQVLLDI